MREATAPPSAKRGSKRTGSSEFTQVEQQNAELREVISVAAHDLREPLRALRACAERLVREHATKLDGEARELVDWLERAARRTEKLSADLLLYSRVVSGPLKLERVTLSEPLEWAFANLRDRIDEHGTRVTHDPLPVVSADAGRMIQLFQNLLSNALTYRGEDPAVVHIGCSRRGEEWVVYVRDRGIGVESRHRETIFDPFERLHSDERYPGTGLGLAISRKIIERHGGTIWVEPSPGGGSTFAFTLPALPGDREAGQPR
jgi:signal transduction histidine kinase